MIYRLVGGFCRWSAVFGGQQLLFGLTLALGQTLLDFVGVVEAEEFDDGVGAVASQQAAVRVQRQRHQPITSLAQDRAELGAAQQ